MFFKKEADERTVGTLNTAIVIVFIGILLTFTTILTFTSEYAMNTEEEYYDKEEHKIIFLEDFSELFYKNSYFTSIIRKYEYNVFSTLPVSDVLCGEDDFIFEVKNKENGYNFWLDCTGKLSFTEEETSLIKNKLSESTAFFAKDGTDLYTAVIPNVQTVYTDKLPFYIIQSEENTRRSQLLFSLSGISDINYIDTTMALKRKASEYPLCNNTENSVTPLGAYFAYAEICGRIMDKYPALKIISEDTLNYQIHYTKGRELAQKASVSEYAENRTVSLTDRMQRYYTVDKSIDSIHTKNTLFSDAPKILISVTQENDKAAFLYFFASTFSECVIEDAEKITADYIKEYSPDIYLRIIHENELGALLK